MEDDIEDEEEELMDFCPYLISFLTEFFGMAIQMFVGCMGSIYTFGTGPLITSFSFGLGRLACYEIFNHISPLHINPAKSFGFLILGRMHFLRFVVYVVAQMAGSVLGTASVIFVVPRDYDSHVCLTHLTHGTVPMGGFVMESITTFILMVAVAGATDPVNEDLRDSLNLRLSFVVFGLVLSIDPFTGAGKNPARSFGPSVLSNDWHDQWLYLVGPFLGAGLGALIYRFVLNYHQKSLHRLLILHGVP